MEGTTLEILTIHPTYNDYRCPLINTGGITPWFKCYTCPSGRSNKAIRGIPGHLASLRRQLPETAIEIRYIVQT